MKRPTNPCIKCAEKCTGKCDHRVEYEKEEIKYREFVREQGFYEAEVEGGDQMSNLNKGGTMRDVKEIQRNQTL